MTGVFTIRRRVMNKLSSRSQRASFCFTLLGAGGNRATISSKGGGRVTTDGRPSRREDVERLSNSLLPLCRGMAVPSSISEDLNSLRGANCSRARLTLALVNMRIVAGSISLLSQRYRAAFGATLKALIKQNSAAWRKRCSIRCSNALSLWRLKHVNKHQHLSPHRHHFSAHLATLTVALLATSRRRWRRAACNSLSGAAVSFSTYFLAARCTVRRGDHRCACSSHRPRLSHYIRFAAWHLPAVARSRGYRRI